MKKMPLKKLTLSRETLTELTGPCLEPVAGGASKRDTCTTCVYTCTSFLC